MARGILLPASREPRPIRVNVSLRLYPGSMTAAAVSDRLDLIATSALGVDGSPEPAVTGRYRTGRHNGWFLDSEDRVKSDDPLVHIEWMLESLEPRLERLQAILVQPDARGQLTLILWSKHGGYALLMPPDLLRRLAAMDLPLWLDFADYDDEDDDLLSPRGG